MKNKPCSNKISNKGFSLVELLIVLAIGGVFLSIVFGSVFSSRAAARDLRRVSDIKQIQLGLVLYFEKYRYYPPSTTGVLATDLSLLLTEKVIPNLPTNPQGTSYVYTASGVKPKTFCLGALLEGNPQNFDGNSSCLLTGSTASWYKVQSPQ
jgi:prepilin-type N-terminal cleavage/methylation domain-containing protein